MQRGEGEKTLKKKTHCANIAQQALKQLADGSLTDTRPFTVSDIHARSFEEWIAQAQRTTDKDELRNLLYFGFQPLYDALVDAKLAPSQRQHTLRLLQEVLDLSRSYLTHYYVGAPSVEGTLDRLSHLEDSVMELDGTPYNLKFRNIDYNRIYPVDIHHFHRKILQAIAQGDLETPDTVISCACGSSEIALPLSGLLNIPIGFIRRSHRRGDDHPKIVAEHIPGLQANLSGRNVLCIEDYVCTGRSLWRVMEKTKEYGAKRVWGASIHNSREGSLLQEIMQERGFHLFKHGDYHA